MFSDKKEEGSLPDLPPVKTPFSVGEDTRQSVNEAEETHSLPSFPDSPSHNSFSQAAIKDAVVDGGEKMPDIPEVDDNVKVVEMKEWNPITPPAEEEAPGNIPPLPKVTEPGTNEALELPEDLRLGERVLPPLKTAAAPVSSAGVDVFVKLDKFHSAKKTLSEVRGKLEDVDALIKKIREIKMKEEQEIASWERDLTFAKSRIQEITENIFEKVG